MFNGSSSGKHVWKDSVRKYEIMSSYQKCFVKSSGGGGVVVVVVEDGMNQTAGIILACAMCAMAHCYYIWRTEIWPVRHDGARFSRMAHDNFTCAPFFLELV